MAPNRPPAAADPDFGGTLLAPSNCYWKHLLADLDITEAMMLQQSNALNTVLLVRCAAVWAAALRCGLQHLAPISRGPPECDLTGRPFRRHLSIGCAVPHSEGQGDPLQGPVQWPGAGNDAGPVNRGALVHLALIEARMPGRLDCRSRHRPPTVHSLVLPAC